MMDPAKESLGQPVQGLKRSLSGGPPSLSEGRGLTSARGRTDLGTSGLRVFIDKM
jgi:hypothetical protein